MAVDLVAYWDGHWHVVVRRGHGLKHGEAMVNKIAQNYSKHCQYKRKNSGDQNDQTHDICEIQNTESWTEKQKERERFYLIFFR